MTMNKLLIIGASGHGKVIADIARLNGYTDIAFLDDDSSKTECNGYPVVGSVAKAMQIIYSDFIVAIGNANTRQQIQESLISNGLNVVTLIHPKAVIAEKVIIGKGTVIMAGAVINSETSIGDGCIINTCASIDHDCVIGNYVHVSVGSHIAGTVEVYDRTWIGIGATVSNNLTITSDCTIGAGAVVINDIKNKGTYVGVPCEMIKLNRCSNRGGKPLVFGNDTLVKQSILVA